MPDYIQSSFYLFVVAPAAGFTGAFMAVNRRRDALLWCILCSLLPPLLFILYFVRPPASRRNLQKVQLTR